MSEISCPFCGNTIRGRDDHDLGYNYSVHVQSRHPDELAKLRNQRQQISSGQYRKGCFKSTFGIGLVLVGFVYVVYRAVRKAGST